MAQKRKPRASTQKHLTFKSIKKGVVIMKGGVLVAVLMVNSINFNLKSRDEQTALLNSYKNFLNSLSFPIQIVVQSRTLDLDEYLGKLEKAEKNQRNELLQLQTREYISFVRELLGVANIMSKTFYVVVSYHLRTAPLGFFARLFGKRPITPAGKFKEAKAELVRRANLVANGLSPMGLDSILLNTEELVDLLYTTYNPDTARRQKLFNVSHVDADVIIALAKKKET